MKRSESISKFIVLAPLISVCILTCALILPTINNNINDTNLIGYFNADEGGAADLMWYYYTGVKPREHLQWDYDYGLEYRYLTDFARIISGVVKFTPGTFILILRWVHLLAWLGALIVMWRFVGHHFFKGWQRDIVILLLSVRPALAYFSTNLKPEPLVLIFMILGLDYSLRIIDKRSYMYIFISIACAAVAFLIKFSGIFLLPAIIAALYFSDHIKSQERRAAERIWHKISFSWTLPALCGVFIMTALFLIITVYLRKSTGHTWGYDYGIFGTLCHIKIMLYAVIVAIIMILMSAILFIMKHSRSKKISSIYEQLDDINSYSFLVFSLFVVFVAIFGVRWFVTPRDFISTYAQIGPAAFDEKLYASANIVSRMVHNFIGRLCAFDLIILLLMCCYVVAEIRSFKNNRQHEIVGLFKRETLAIFIMPIFPMMISGIRFEQHHMLPFYCAASVLAIKGMQMWKDESKHSSRYVYILIIILLVADFLVNGHILLKDRMREYRQKEDVVFEISKWMRANILADTRIAADYYSRAYLPPEYKNVRHFVGYQKDKMDQLLSIVEVFKPKVIYYSICALDDPPSPLLETVFKDPKVKMIKLFNGDYGYYRSHPKSKFLIYKVQYD